MKTKKRTEKKKTTAIAKEFKLHLLYQLQLSLYALMYIWLIGFGYLLWLLIKAKPSQANRFKHRYSLLILLTARPLGLGLDSVESGLDKHI